MKPILSRAPALSRGSRELCKHTTIPAVAVVSTATMNTRRPFSILNRPPPNYPGHVPLTRIERAGLAIGSGLISLANPYRGDLIASFAEATSTPYFLPRLRDAMLSSPTGRRILRDRPRMTSTSLDLPHLRSLGRATVGGTYVSWLDREGVSPDTRAAVRYVDDEECAYVMQRYRECHDFYHALTGLPVVREGEVALKAFEWANTGLPMTGLATLAAFTMRRAEQGRFVGIYLPWALRNGWRCEEVINVYWEEELESDVGELRRRLGVEPPPDLRALRTREREENRRRKRAAEEAKKAAASVVGGATA
ncbi:Ubiquinone biosynthesis protein [Cytospora paraplurivora]|uniref:4-hydroxy-3-methoxy-5-polyprenylbenzoate decarboxylase n=1 Tax=Cytospora paraplurivora TaxID=2898453 RepID=A0AAN9YFN8_9PEZI